MMTRRIFGVSIASLAALATGAAAFTPSMPATLSGGVGVDGAAPGGAGGTAARYTSFLPSALTA